MSPGRNPQPRKPLKLKAERISIAEFFRHPFHLTKVATCASRYRHIKADTITRQPAHIIDFMPTFLELAGAKYPEKHDGNDILPVEGKSIVPILDGRTREAHKQLAWEWSGNRALREGDWKVVWDSKVKEWELYNLAKDRCETENLAASQPERTARLSEAWMKWAKETGLSVGAGDKARKKKKS